MSTADQPGPLCLAPPAPELLERIVATRARMLAGRRPGEPTGTGVELLDPAAMTALQSRRTLIKRFGDGDGRPATGTRNVLLLLADFTDQPATRAAADVRDMVFSTGSYPTGSVRDFFVEASYGALTVTGRASGRNGPSAGWYRAPHPRSFYVDGEFGTGAAPHNTQALVEDLIAAAVRYVDFGRHDGDGDGELDALVVVAAGAGAERTGRADDIWSHTWTLPEPIVADGVRIAEYCVVPEYGPVGVLAHELGHTLMGWPDLYDADFSSPGTGEWDVMAAGTWNRDGHRPAHPSAWCKYRAGWVRPTEVTGTLTATVAPYSARPDVYKLPVAGTSGAEYFLASNRQRAGFDDGLPAAGLIIEHVDERHRGNTDEHHALVGVRPCTGPDEVTLHPHGPDPAARISGIRPAGTRITAVLTAGAGDAQSPLPVVR
jgi:immune inhibitor A